MSAHDLRGWLDQVEKTGNLKTVKGASPDLEIGCLTDLNLENNGPALLFDDIAGHASGMRVLTCSTSSRRLIELTFGLPASSGERELVQVLRQRLLQWDRSYGGFDPRTVVDGPVLENILSGDNVDIYRFPCPKWHDLDGGLFIGTGDAVITRDPDTGDVNLGTYRMQVHDARTLGLQMIPTQHGKLNIEKYHRAGKEAPVAVSLGHHPLVFRIACREVPIGSEYGYIGAIGGGPVAVVKEEVTGLPIPAMSEIVMAGWCPPGQTMDEGPFGEFTGYYARKKGPAPIVRIERVYHRRDPVELGSPPGRIGDSGYYMTVTGSAMLHNELLAGGMRGISGIWLHETAKQMFIIAAIEQSYAGQVMEVAMFISHTRIGANMGRYIVVVDADIDPTDSRQVIWAIGTRSDPAANISVFTRARGNPLDPVSRSTNQIYYNSRAIIDACKPFDWIKDFPKEISLDEELVRRVRSKWPDAAN
ncbi:MAG: UbiD family decarboxylase [Chloroflexi bacterium]|nr:UbiD family decarboxylase [Chloroflexota bacterium]